MYLAKQNDDDTYTANTNIIVEVANFISFFLEDNDLPMDMMSEIIG